MNIKQILTRRRSFFVQLILSNLLVSLVCVVSMAAILLFTMGEKEQVQQRSRFQAAAQADAREVVRVLESTKDIANNLLFVQQVRPFTYQQHPIRAIELIDSLNTLMAANPFLSEIYVYFYQDDYVYSSRNSQKSKNFFATIGQDMQQGRALKDQMSVYMQPEYRMVGEELFVFYPYMSNYENEGMIVFRLSGAMLQQLLPVQDEPFQVTALYSGQSFLGSPLLTPQLQEQLLAACAGVNSTPNQNNPLYIQNGYKLFSMALSPNLQYISVNKDSSIYGFLLNPKAFVFLLLLCLCAVILAAWYFARKSYYPVRVLHNTLHSQGALTQTESFLEFQDFALGYTGLQEKNEQLLGELQEKCDLQRAQLLGALLHGNTEGYEDFSAHALDLGLELDAAYHLLVSVQGDQGLFLNVLRPLMEYRRRYTHSLVVMPGETLYIVGCEERPDAETLEYIGSMEGIALGGPVQDKGQLHRCYMRLRAGRIAVGASQNTTALLEYYTKENQRIPPLLEAEALDSLQELVAQLAGVLSAGQLPLPAVRYLCYEVFYQFRNFQENHALLQRGCLLSPEGVLREAGNDAGGLAAALEVETQRLVDQIQAQGTPGLNIEAIIQCVQAHYIEPSFSLQMVAETFSVSSSYLSSYFKEHYGMKMLDYYTLLRMERAKELLRTDATLLEISQQIGYYNISSFIRRFKQVTGMTPGEYKKL